MFQTQQRAAAPAPSPFRRIWRRNPASSSSAMEHRSSSITRMPIVHAWRPISQILFRRTRGLTLVPQPGGSRAIVIRRLADPHATGKEGYRLEVTPAGVTISASQTAGLFYGTITLWQLLTRRRVLRIADHSGVAD